MRFILLISIGAIAFPSICYSKNPELPSNVIIREQSKHAAYLDAVDFSYKPTKQISFAKLKLCIAENITNNAVTLQDATGAFVGPATGTYYSNVQSQTIQGSGIFKYLDDSSSTLIATGTINGGSDSLGLIMYILKFDLKAVLDSEDLILKFTNITRAQQYTGIAANDGFQPVGTWNGAKPLLAYTALEGVSVKLKACL